MRIKEKKHFAGKYPRPEFKTYENGSLLALNSFWGEEKEDLLSPVIESSIPLMTETDEDITLIFESNDSLSFKTNLLVSALHKMNKLIYESNLEDLSSLVESLLIYQIESKIIIAHSSSMNLFLMNQGKMIPVLQNSDLSILQKVNGSPFPQSFLGGYEKANIQTQILNIEDEDEIFLSSFNLSYYPEYNKESFSNTFNEMTEKSNGKSFWSAIIDFNQEEEV